MALAEKPTELIEIDGLKFHSIAEAEIQAAMGFVDQDKIEELKTETNTQRIERQSLASRIREIVNH
jgi:hypothetical protein